MINRYKTVARFDRSIKNLVKEHDDMVGCYLYR